MSALQEVRFDIIALQEVRGDLGALRRILGREWSYLATDVTEGDLGNGERMVFVYRRERARFDSIAGELTLPHGGEVLDAGGLELESAPSGGAPSEPPMPLEQRAARRRRASADASREQV